MGRLISDRLKVSLRKFNESAMEGQYELYERVTTKTAGGSSKQAPANSPYATGNYRSRTQTVQVLQGGAVLPVLRTEVTLSGAPDVQPQQYIKLDGVLHEITELIEGTYKPNPKVVVKRVS